MRALLWVLRIVLFLLLFTFAVKNSSPVNVRFFLDAAWQAPLIIVLLAFFVGGAALAVLSLMTMLFRLRRQVAELQRELAGAQAGKPDGSDLLSSTRLHNKTGAPVILTKSPHD